MTNFANQLTAAAAEHPDHPAIKFGDLVLSYKLLHGATAHAAGLLRSRGVEAGARVGIALPNVPYFPLVYFGALRLGAIVVPMNPLLKEREVAYHLSDCGARLIVGWQDFADAGTRGAEQAGAESMIVTLGEFERMVGEAAPLGEVSERRDDDPAVVIYTSGTTGAPKGATLTHANLYATAKTGRDLVEAGPHTVMIGALPLFHVFGMSAIMNLTIHAHGLLTLIPRFEAGNVLEVIERDRGTTFGGVPTMFAALLHDPERERHDVSSINLCVSGGAPMPVEILRGFDEAFGAKVLEGYGLSESTGMGTFNPPDRERKPGSIGVPMGGTEIRLVDDDDNDVPAGEPGELVMRGPFVMKGYWNREDATREVMRGGWLHTGDIATVDEDGYYYIVDRKKDLIIRGGYNVYPREIEEVLYTHPAVREAAVVGVPHASLGEEVGAAVALKEGAEATPDELRDYLKQRVAAYKYARVVWMVDDLPKGPTGKVLKREIEVPEAAKAR